MRGVEEIRTLARCIGLRLSPGYQAAVSRDYWVKLPSTHGEMSSGKFDFYAEQIFRMINPAPGAVILDYACGRGEIGRRWIQAGYNVEFSDWQPGFVDELRGAGLTAFLPGEIPAGHYDVVVCNNALCCTHPRRLREAIENLLAKVKPGGRLIISDEPTLRRRGGLRGSWFFRKIVWRWTGVFSPEIGCFFIDEKKVDAWFPDVRIVDSWNSYRQHFIISKQ